MLDTDPDFILRKYSNFLIDSEINKSSPPQFSKLYIALAFFVGMFIIFVVSKTKISLIPLGLICGGIMVTLRVMTP